MPVSQRQPAKSDIAAPSHLQRSNPGAVDHQDAAFQREIYRRLWQVLEMTRAIKAYSMLHLGCESLHHLAPVLRATEPARYIGADPSAKALEQARQHLDGLPGVEMWQQDMHTALAASAARFDVIFSAFAMHHLPSEAKREWFASCAAHLEKDGLLIIADEVLSPRQASHASGSRPLPHHHPEQVADLQAMGLAAGFGEFSLVCQQRQQAMMAFYF